MMDREKIIAKLEKEVKRTYAIKTTLFDGTEKVGEEITVKREPFVTLTVEMADKILALLKEQEARIQKYEYVFDFLGIGFREWTTKILNGEAEAICETDEHEYKTVVTFKLI